MFPQLLSPVPFVSHRLRWLRRGDQARAVSAGSGAAVAPHLLQMPHVWLRPHWRVHQQVGALMCAASKTLLYIIMSLG